jgi:hypothetical protein
MYFDTLFFTRWSLWPNCFRIELFQPRPGLCGEACKGGLEIRFPRANYSICNGSRISDTALTYRKSFDLSLLHQTAQAGPTVQKISKPPKPLTLLTGHPIF